MRKVLTYSSSCIWSAGSWAGRELSKKGVLKSVRLDSRVISVGNLQAGGGGKTPLVSLIANEAADRGLQVGILLRGYKSRWEKSGGIILSGESMIDPRLCGDEAALLHDLCPRASIGVGADRIRQYRRLVDALDKKMDRRLDLVILDDGFQSWKIQKDLNIVSLTSSRPWERVFRDLPRAVREADLAVWTKGDRRPSHFDVPLVRVSYKISADLMNRPIWLVTGIADGKSAHQLVSASGYQVEKHFSFPDHYRYNSTQVHKILKQASGRDCKVALTGKDWVKWKSLGISQSEVLVLEPKLVFLEGRELWLQMLWGQS